MRAVGLLLGCLALAGCALPLPPPSAFLKADAGFDAAADGLGDAAGADALADAAADADAGDVGGADAGDAPGADLADTAVQPDVVAAQDGEAPKDAVAPLDAVAPQDVVAPADAIAPQDSAVPADVPVVPDVAGDAADTVAAQDVPTDAATGACGNGSCDGDESVPTCPADCGYLANHLGAGCATPGANDGCDIGFYCAARANAAGGNVCVADFPTWGALPDAHPAADFTAAADYATDNNTGLSWSKESQDPMDWNAALIACKAKTYGGFGDWRLPTRAELRSLVDFTKADPASSAPVLSWPTDTLWYWSTVPWPLDSGVFLVSFSSGRTDSYTVVSPARVRCVRGLAAAPKTPGAAGRYALQDAGKVVLDRLTGLHWQQGFATTLTQGDAVNWCKNTAGLPGSGWRAPSVRELDSLIEMQGKSLPINAAFAGTPTQYFWSSSLSASGSGAWYVSFYSGFSDASDASATNAVRCVR